MVQTLKNGSGENPYRGKFVHPGPMRANLSFTFIVYHIKAKF